MKLLVVCLLASVALAAATSVPFKNCVDGSKATITGLDLKPYPVQKGNPLTVTASGSLSEQLTSGNFQLTVDFLGIQIFQTSGDICTLDPSFKCPVQPGNINISQTATIPGIAPSGSYQIVINSTDQNGAVLMCVSIPLQIQVAAPAPAPVRHNVRDIDYLVVAEEPTVEQDDVVVVTTPPKKKSHSADPVRVPHPAVDSDPAVRPEMVEYVNTVQSSWVAGPQRRFAGLTIAHAKRLCGVKEGGKRLPLKKDTSLAIRAVPDTFDARTAWPNCSSIGHVRDQGACGSCWAFGASESMTDRFCISSNGQQTPYLAAEDLVSCCGPFTCGNGCDGGYPSGAWEYWTETGLVTGGDYDSKQGCMPYEVAACDHHVNGTLPPCGDEGPTPACVKTCQNGANWKNDKHFGASAYSVSTSVLAIQTEIMTHGPVEAAYTVYEDFLSYKSGVYVHTSGEELGGHAVKILGWGTENNQPYWLVANSWNDQWGDQGFFKILRGKDECGIEDQIVAGLPKLSTKH